MNAFFDNVNDEDIVVLGMPFDAYSSHLKGAAQAPKVVRELMKTGSLNSSTELGADLKGNPRIIAVGDLSWQDESEAFDTLEQFVANVAAKGAKPLTLGGDHSITYPIMKSLAAHHSDITIVHFDAHPDLYDEFRGNPLSHACPFARIMENSLASRLIQIGIRTLNQHQREQAEKFGVEVHEMRNWTGQESLKIQGPVYITIDIDALDPAFAPGVSHIEPGGLSVRQILDVIHAINAPIIGADIVEFNPTRDINDMTAVVVNKLYKEVCGKMLERR